VLKRECPKELYRLKSILKVDSDVLMKDVQETAPVIYPTIAKWKFKV
jgi:hypothetical protein